MKWMVVRPGSYVFLYYFIMPLLTALPYSISILMDVKKHYVNNIFTRIDKKKYSFDGADDVEFLISTNVGENVKPLSSVASGGELSRIMLALRKILSSPEKNETLIFDEIDTGVSGKASVRIAQKMKQMSKTAQVITVTHLAQIAAYADEHLKIEKKDNGQRTFTTVTELDEKGRVEELARLLGGDIASSAVETAKDMLVSAKKFN